MKSAFIWNPSNCNCECDKSCNMSEYLDYKNCNWKEKVAYSLVEECDEDELVHNGTLSINKIQQNIEQFIK